MYAYTTVALAAATFTTFIQPCPAPPLVLGALGTAVLSGGVAGVAGNLFGQVTDAFGGGEKRDVPVDDNATGINACISQAVEQGGKGVGVEPGEGSSVIINGLPKVCLKEAQAYNADPKNGAMAPVMGTSTILNSTAVKIDGINPDQLAKISEQIKANPHRAQRRSIRFEKY